MEKRVDKYYKCVLEEKVRLKESGEMKNKFESQVEDRKNGKFLYSLNEICLEEAKSRCKERHIKLSNKKFS